jgi:hypothetical protein
MARANRNWGASRRSRPGTLGMKRCVGLGRRDDNSHSMGGTTRSQRRVKWARRDDSGFRRRADRVTMTSSHEAIQGCMPRRNQAGDSDQARMGCKSPFLVRWPSFRMKNGRRSCGRVACAEADGFPLQSQRAPRTFSTAVPFSGGWGNGMKGTLPAARSVAKSCTLWGVEFHPKSPTTSRPIQSAIGALAIWVQLVVRSSRRQIDVAASLLPRFRLPPPVSECVCAKVAGAMQSICVPS